MSSVQIDSVTNTTSSYNTTPKSKVAIDKRINMVQCCPLPPITKEKHQKASKFCEHQPMVRKHTFSDQLTTILHVLIGASRTMS